MVVTEGPQPTAERPFDAAHVEQTLAAELLPPTDPQERKFLKRFTQRAAAQLPARIEYPLLLAAAGVKRFRPAQFSRRPLRRRTSPRNGGTIATRICDQHGGRQSLDLLENAYSWSDRLAGHFAQTYRSGHVFNFVLGGLAVCLGLSSFMAPHASLQLAMVEFLITLGIILNTKIGRAQRMAPALARLSPAGRAAAADAQPEAARRSPLRTRPAASPTRSRRAGSTGMRPASGGRWAAPAARSTKPKRAELARAVAAFEIAPQVAYHQKSAAPDRHARPPAGEGRRPVVQGDVGRLRPGHRRAAVRAATG